MGMAVAQAAGIPTWLVWLLGGIGGLVAFVLQLVQVGWFFIAYRTFPCGSSSHRMHSALCWCCLRWMPPGRVV